MGSEDDCNRRRVGMRAGTVLTRLSRARAIMFCSVLSQFSGSIVLAEVATRASEKCYEDAMLIFDASGSMLGIDEGGSDDPSKTRIDGARTALAESLPQVSPFRRIGLMSYGPGGHCKVILHMTPQVNAGSKIMAEVNSIVPDGLTPLTSAVEQAANVLQYRSKAALIVLLTDGEETCEGDPCELASILKATGKGIIVHVIGYRMKDLISTREKGIADMKCLAAKTGGRFISVDKVSELVAALNATLGCPMLSKAMPPREHRYAGQLEPTGSTPK